CRPLFCLGPLSVSTSAFALAQVPAGPAGDNVSRRASELVIAVVYGGVQHHRRSGACPKLGTVGIACSTAQGTASSVTPGDACTAGTRSLPGSSGGSWC